MKYLVTGGAGFIGSNLTEYLIKEGHEIIIVDDLSSGFLKNLSGDRNLQFIKARIQDTGIEKLKSIEGIFHLAAQASVPVSIDNFYSSSINNLSSSIYVFEIAKTFKIPVVYASSSAIYGNLPFGDDEINEFDILSPYAQDKLAMEEYAKLCFRLYNVSSIGLRFFNVYGPKQDPKNPYSGVISIFIDRFIQKKPVLINGGNQTRDFIFIKDIVNVLIKSMETANNNYQFNFFNVGTGVEININTLYEKLVEIFNYRPEIIRKPLPEGDPERSSGSYKKLFREMKIIPGDFTKLNKGLKETVNYFKIYNSKNEGV
ncbi:MAG: NAD-dependent epimerase/dehydratase family protein [Bacteroidetes bacterium]|nr:MAG: NAD-dependent epimerase/dehydratase family protein [Bacteroidota bacterium]